MTSGSPGANFLGLPVGLRNLRSVEHLKCHALFVPSFMVGYI